MPLPHPHVIARTASYEELKGALTKIGTKDEG
jgi:hypothetical protein